MTIVTSSIADIERWLHTSGFSLRSDQFTFSIPGVNSTWPGYGAGSEITKPGFALPDASLATGMRAAIAAWDAIIASDFAEVADNASSRGELRVAYTDMNGAGAYAYSGTPRPPGSSIGDIWINADSQGEDWSAGFAFETLLHEIGHTLGLKHSFEAPVAPTTLDDTRFTVMSYTTSDAVVWSFGINGGGLSAQGSHATAITPMVLDVAAAQAIYGAETTTRIGNDVYTFTQRSPTRQTIYDAGGIDLIDISNFTLASTIDLRSGAYSSLGIMNAQAQIDYWTAIYPSYSNFIANVINGEPELYTYTDNLGIALNTVIEDATGGTGNDLLIGNAVANVLNGGGGNDYLIGNEGNDLLGGGSGSNTLQGGLGDDIYVVSVNGDSVIEFAGEGNDEVRTALAALTLAANVEMLTYTGGSAAALLIGSAIDNVIVGGIGRDQIYGREGHDRLNDGGGTAGNEDTLVGGLGNDVYIVNVRGASTIEYAGEGTDEVQTNFSVYGLQAFIENLTFLDSARHAAGVGNELANRLTGGSGGDDLFGRAGNDILIGGEGTANTLLGQEGDDIYIVGATGDTVIEFAGEGADEVQTWLLNFVLRDNVERLTYSGAGDFTGIGSSDDNRIAGGNGADFLSGLAGGDTLIGGNGSDQLLGGDGSDRFIYNGGETGLDRILDFASGIDKIVLSATGFIHTATFDLAQGDVLTPTTANSTFIFNAGNGILAYDPDGIGAGVAVQLAQLNAGLTLTTSDLLLI